MFVYALEGPAGSGKSTLIDRLIREPHPELLDNTFVGRVTDQVHTTQRDLGSGFYMATARDLMRWTRALNIASESTGTPILFFDRFLLGSYVYESVRGDTPLPMQAAFDRSFSGWVYALWGVQQALIQRGKDVPKCINLEFRCIRTDIFQLEVRRNSGMKVYPFAPQREIVTYGLVFKMLESFLDKWSHAIPRGLEINMEYLDPRKEDSGWQW